MLKNKTLNSLVSSDDVITRTNKKKVLASYELAENFRTMINTILIFGEKMVFLFANVAKKF